MTVLGLVSQVEERTITYTYDPLNRLTAADTSGGEYYHYTYDPTGNRLALDHSGTETSYQYDDANRLVSVGGQAYTWDNNGNLLDDGTNTYTYDPANRLKSVVGGGNTYSYTYNGLNNRVGQVVNGVALSYVLDQDSGLSQVLSDGTHAYLYGNGRIAQMGQQAEYFLPDALGSVRQMVNAGGAVTLSRRYDPYGQVITSQGSSETVFGYTGEQTDPSGMVYLRARYYSPLQGRFVSEDTWEGDAVDPLSYNRWAYVQENPISRRDPSGRCYTNSNIFSSGYWARFWESPILGPCDSDQNNMEKNIYSNNTQQTPSPTCTTTSTPTVTPTSIPVAIVSKTIFFGGSNGSSLADPGPDPKIQTPVWVIDADVYKYPGGSKNAQADEVNISSYKNNTIIIIGYSAGADTALIFANKFRDYQKKNSILGSISDVIILGGTIDR